MVITFNVNLQLASWVLGFLQFAHSYVPSFALVKKAKLYHHGLVRFLLLKIPIFCEMLAWLEKKCFGHIELIIQIHSNNMSEYRWNVPSLDPIVKTDVMCQTYVGRHVSVRIDVYYIYSPFWAWGSVQLLECVMCYGHHREIVWLCFITIQRLIILKHHLHKSHFQILVANTRQFGLPPHFLK